MDNTLNIPENIFSMLKATTAANDITPTCVDGDTTPCTSCDTCQSCDICLDPCMTGAQYRNTGCESGCQMCNSGCMAVCNSCEVCNQCQARCEIGNQTISLRPNIGHFSFQTDISKDKAIYSDDWNSLVNYVYTAYNEDWRPNASLLDYIVDRDELFYANNFNYINNQINGLLNANTAITSKDRDDIIYATYFTQMASALNEAKIRNLPCFSENSNRSCEASSSCEVCITGCDGQCDTGCQTSACNVQQIICVALNA